MALKPSIASTNPGSEIAEQYLVNQTVVILKAENVNIPVENSKTHDTQLRNNTTMFFSLSTCEERTASLTKL